MPFTVRKLCCAPVRHLNVAEERVEADFQHYPADIRPRLRLHSVGAPDLPPSPEALNVILKDLVDGMKSADFETKPTKFILDQLFGSALTPFLRDKYPGVRVFMTWSGAVTCLYSMVGACSAWTFALRSAHLQLPRRTGGQITRRSSKSTPRERTRRNWMNLSSR